MRRRGDHGAMLSRRALLRAAALTGIASGAAAFLAACGSPAPIERSLPGPPTGSSGSPSAAGSGYASPPAHTVPGLPVSTRAPGGTLRIAAANDVAQLDP